MIEKIRATDKEVRKFGLMFGAIAVVIATYMLFRHNNSWLWFLCGAVFFLTTGLLLRPVLRPLYIGWMMFAFALGWVNARLLLGLFFYVVLTPIGLFMRLTGKDLLDRRIDRAAESYWLKREDAPFDKSRYDRLF